MINKKYLKLLRSSNRYRENNFIYKLIAERIVDSIDLLKINIDNILEIGINDNNVSDFLINKFKYQNFDRADLHIPKSFKNKKNNFLEIDLENLSLKSDFYNLVYSNTFIHLIDFENILKIIYKSLKPNGFMIAAIPSKDSMYQLLNSMYETDLDLYNGAYQRFNPTIKIEDILNILKKLNFELPTVYSDNILIEYSDFDKLLNDVKKLRLSYCFNDKKKIFEKKQYFQKLENIYKKNYFNKNYNLEIKMNFLSAWKK